MISYSYLRMIIMYKNVYKIIYLYKNYLYKHPVEYLRRYKRKYLLNFEITFSKTNWYHMMKI